MSHEPVEPEGLVDLPPGWSRAQPEHIPHPTYWPVVLALGVTFIFWGLISTLIITVLGVLLFIISAAGWIGEWLHES